ncbi:hypothetical protein SLS55_002087 [Diplodia seriata]|uniref:Clr5 domain-containing protein n=1 Tax=Diplodia seriata TaxID=420778 RepID=A0ABR3CR70_9PEZI
MEELWLSHKETIRDLYLVKDMTRQDVMSKMEEFYGFKASAGQYERKFKKWGFRKNLTLSEWQLVSQRIDKRKRDGKETNLRIDGIPVPPKKLNRAMQRHGQGPPFNISRETLLSQDLNLTASLLKTFVFNMADLLPGPWPYTKPGSALWRLRNDQDARPPLQVAIETGNIKLVRNLIDHGADVNVVGAGGRDMFNVAAAVRSEDILDLLLESVQEISLPSLLACLAHGFFDHASRIWPQIKGLISVHEKLETEMLTGAVRAGHIPLVKDLLENGADPNAFNKAHQSPLQLASESDGDCLAIAEILVKWGAEPDFRFDDGDDDLRMPTPLQNAARRNNFAVAAFLIDKGADPNAESVCDDTDDTLYKEWGFYAYDCCTLNVALRAESDTRMIELLLEAGADPDDATLSDALEYHNDPQIFRLLMRHDAPLSSVLFFYAARAGNIGVVQLCLDAGMDPNEIYSAAQLKVVIKRSSRSCSKLEPRPTFQHAEDSEKLLSSPQRNMAITM